MSQPAPPPGRLVLLATSPRVAPGLLSADAWDALRGAPLVLAGDPDHPQLPYLRAAGVAVEVDPPAAPATRAARLAELAGAQTVVWLVGPDGDQDLGLALAGALTTRSPAPELEVLPGSYDLPGARLIDVVAVMDRLRSPGGCPWDAQQTHESLVTYLVEETYETLEAIETGDRAHLREELGDLLLQVVFHARIAQEHDTEPWQVDDIAADLVDKLVRRHPHVFAGGGAQDAEQLEESWDRLKAAEKGRTSATEGVPLGLPALALVTKLLGRARRAGIRVAAPEGDPASVGSRLFALAAEAQAAGLDPEAELRAAARRYAEAVRGEEERRVGTVGG
jgi:XTP/dITP diphosphohydrolase